MRASGLLREVEDIDHREEGGVQRVEDKMCLVPAAIFHLQFTYAHTKECFFLAIDKNQLKDNRGMAK